MTTTGTQTIEIPAAAYDRLDALTRTTGKSMDALLEAGLSTLGDALPTLTNALAVVRERMTPHQWGLIVAGAKIEDALALEPGSQLDPCWVGFVSPSCKARENVSNILEGYVMERDPDAAQLAAVQSIITQTLGGAA